MTPPNAPATHPATARPPAGQPLAALNAAAEQLWLRLNAILEAHQSGDDPAGSQRNGSNWLRPNPATGVSEVTDTSSFPSTAIFSPTLADRRQEKIKLFGNWQPDEKLALQFTAEGGTNKYSMPTAYALQNTRLSLYSVDGTYAISDNWNLTAYASWGQQTQNQARPAGSVMAFETTNTSAGLGVTGKPTGKLELGGPFMDSAAGGMMIPAAGLGEDEIRKFAQDDPAVRSGLLRAEVRPWLIGMRK